MNPSHFLELTVKTSLLLGIAFACTLVLRRWKAGLRHLVWVIALSGTLAMPLLEGILPKVEVPTFASSSTEIPVKPIIDEQVATRMSTKADPQYIEGPSKPQHVLPTLPGVANMSTAEAAITPPKPPTDFHWNALSLTIWGTVAGALILYWFFRFALIQRIDRKIYVPPLGPYALPLRRKIVFLVSCEQAPMVPLTWGLFRPKVLLPKSSEDWPVSHIEAVLTHEIAHIRRCDSLWQGIAFFVCAVHWFNPLVWLAAKALRAEAEHAADESVLDAGVSPVEYASTLVTLAAAASGRSRRNPHAGVAFMNPNKLERRIDAILSPVRPQRGSVTTAGLLVSSAMIVLGIIGAAGARGASSSRHAAQISGADQKRMPLTDTTANIKSNLWKITLKQDDVVTLVFVYQKGTELRGYESTKTRGGGISTSGRGGGSTEALDTWKLDRFGKLNDGTLIEPYRVIRPEYRMLLAQNGISVTASTMRELKNNYAVGVPPDADEEKQDFVRQNYGNDASRAVGAAVFYKGDVIGIVRQSQLKKGQTEGWPWPELEDSAAAVHPTGYWKVEFPAALNPTVYVVHNIGEKVQITELTARCELVQPVDGNQVTVDGVLQIASAWYLETRTESWDGGGTFNINGATLRPQYLDDPVYRERLKPTGIRVAVATPADEAELAPPHFTPQLERMLASAALAMARERVQAEVQFRANPPSAPAQSRIVGTVNSQDMTRGEIVVPGRRFATATMAPHEVTRTPFDEKVSGELMSRADDQLKGAAEEWARAAVAVHSEKQANKSGSKTLFDAEDHLQQVQQEIQKIAMSYGMTPGSPPFDAPEGSLRFFKATVKKLTAHYGELERKADEADAKFRQQKTSEFDKELIENLAAIEQYKLRSLEQRIRSTDSRPKGARFIGGSETEQRRYRFEGNPVDLDAKSEDLMAVLNKLFRRQAVPFTIDSQVHGNVTISAKSAPGGTVLREILKQVGAKFVIEDGTFHVVPGP